MVDTGRPRDIPSPVLNDQYTTCCSEYRPSVLMRGAFGISMALRYLIGAAYLAMVRDRIEPLLPVRLVRSLRQNLLLFIASADMYAHRCATGLEVQHASFAKLRGASGPLLRGLLIYLAVSS